MRRHECAHAHSGGAHRDIGTARVEDTTDSRDRDVCSVNSETSWKWLKVFLVLLIDVLLYACRP